MLTANDAPKEIVEQAFELAKAQASVDGAFSDALLMNWFRSAWDLCASMVGFTFPPQEITETIWLNERGRFHLTYRPTSEVKLWSGGTLLAVLPPSLDRSCCMPSLCCYCDLRAQYWIGEDTCEIPPRFLQAVARLFTYIAENRGDTELDPHVLMRCGAFAFLAPDVTYAL